MSICGDGVIDWWIIGLVVSLAVILITLVGLRLWKLMGPRLRFSLPVVLFVLTAGVATVEAQKSGNAPMRMPRLEDLSQLSGVTGGNETPTTVTEGRDLVPEDSCGPITYPTNSAPVEALRFFGVAATSTNVWLGIEWPLGEVA